MVLEGELGSRGGLDPVVGHERVDPGGPETQGDGGELGVEGGDGLEWAARHADGQVVLVTLPS